MKSEPKLAVLDMVGTTVRADDHVSEAFTEAFSRFDLSVGPEEVSAVRGRSKVEAIRRLVGLHESDDERAEALAQQVYSSFRCLLMDRYGSQARAIPGAAEALEWLDAQGIGVSLTTGLDRGTAEAILDRLGWGHRIGTMLSGDDVVSGRPAPDLIRAAMALHGEADPGSVVAVGDTVVDLEAAAAAGAGWSVGVLSGAHDREALSSRDPSVLLDSVSDLPEWLKRHAL